MRRASYSNDWREEHRFGSAGFAEFHDLRAAGLLNGRGLPLGFVGDQSLRLDDDAPIITIAGAGSGKLRDLLSYVVCSGPVMPMLIADPRGELAAISWHGLAAHGVRAFFWNPVCIGGLGQDSCNVLDILKADSPQLHADAQFIAEGLIPLTGSANGKYFELRAREWAAQILISRTECHGGTSLPDIGRTINLIQGDPARWADELTAMLSSRYESVRRTAAEMLVKQQESEREFSGIMGELYAYTACLNDPALMAALEPGACSLSDLIDPKRPARIYLNAPTEYLSLWAPVIRLFFTVAMLYKGRAPSSPRVLLLVDEAGQLGRFDALQRAFTYGRGAGVRTWALFQDAGQIEAHYGAPALQSFLGSAQTRQFFGVRDLKTAELLSRMLGTQTLGYDDTLRQDEARKRRREAASAVLMGADPLHAAQEAAHFARAAATRAKQARALLSPDEILNLPEGRQILFISGRNLRPILAHKNAYFTRREMAGLYLPNPYHPPTDAVRVMGRFGPRMLPLIEGPAPEHYLQFPQHRHGRTLWVKGFDPHKR